MVEIPGIETVVGKKTANHVNVRGAMLKQTRVPVLVTSDVVPLGTTWCIVSCLVGCDASTLSV